MIGTEIVQGATYNFAATVPDYPAGAGWALRLVLNPRAGGTVRTVDSTASGDTHLLQVSAATSAAWAVGDYGWQVWALKGAEQYPLEQYRGQLTVVAGLLGASAGTDTRSDARKTLDALKAAFKAQAEGSGFQVGSYTIGGRSVTYRSVADLIKAIQHAEAEVKREEQAAALAAGRPNARRLQVRLGRA